MINFNTDQFIKDHITKRKISLFESDIDTYQKELSVEIKGSNILVIGGAGTIGSSFIKAILPFEPASLTVVDYSENGLTELTRDLRSQKIFIPENYITYPFDFGSAVFKKLMANNTYDTIACFAAHKHVRSEKDPLAIEAMINNNVFNTKKLLDLAVKMNPKHFFSVSTDKAANPVNVMGASKKLMEKVLLAYSTKLKISTARFANVAFSNGSLLAGFIERIFKKQPISAPSDVERYFVSPIESGHLCMLACFLSQTADIFFPKLKKDQMLTFSAIAEDFLSTLGLKADECSSEEEARLKASSWNTGNKYYPVYFFETDTSGEKPFEEFYTEDDILDSSTFKALGIIKKSPAPTHQEIKNALLAFEKLFDKKELKKEMIIDHLSQHLPDFKHIETGKTLDQKM